MYRCAFHWLAVAVLVKYIVPVCVAPSESNSVSEVAWLKVFGSVGSNGATGGGVALAGRFSMYSTLVVAGGARVGGLQAQVAETAGVEAAARERRIDLQALAAAEFTTKPSRFIWKAPARV